MMITIKVTIMQIRLTGPQQLFLTASKLKASQGVHKPPKDAPTGHNTL